jgi:hypothetical protein
MNAQRGALSTALRRYFEQNPGRHVGDARGFALTKT